MWAISVLDLCVVHNRACVACLHAPRMNEPRLSSDLHGAMLPAQTHQATAALRACTSLYGSPSHGPSHVRAKATLQSAPQQTLAYACPIALAPQAAQSATSRRPDLASRSAPHNDTPRQTAAPARTMNGSSSEREKQPCCPPTSHPRPPCRAMIKRPTSRRSRTTLHRQPHADCATTPSATAACAFLDQPHTKHYNNRAAPGH